MACVVPSWALGLRAGNLCFEGIFNRYLLESALELHKIQLASLEPGPVEEQENVLKVVKRKRRKR